MPAPSAFQPAGTNFLGETLTDSRQRFRQLVGSLDAIVASKRLEAGRAHLPKLVAMQTELHRMLNPRDGVDRKSLEQIDRDVTRLEDALKKGWGGTVGKGLLAVLFGAVIGLGGLLWLMLQYFS
ncbi:MAG: hypothetical protein EXS13_08555 [Planctomycetes bacterium]|nr:hypothetical protein [Planctomycetota bacterium]